MAVQNVKRLDEYVEPVKRKTPEMEHLLGIGYEGMTVKQARQIIKERAENPQLWPFEEVRRAEAFLAAYETEPIVVSKRAGWKRTKTTR